MQPTISLIITTYNWPEALELVLLSVLNQSVMPCEVIIADDGSADDTKYLIQRFQDKFTIPLIHSWIEDKGFRAAKNRNHAILKATGDFIVFIDGDIVLHKHFIKGYQRNIRPGCYMMGSRALLDGDYSKRLLTSKNIKVTPFCPGVKNKFNALYLPFLFKFIKGSQSPLVSVKAANMGVWRSDLLKINGFDERFTGWGREDSDLAARLMHLKIKRVNFKGASVCFHLYHKERERDFLFTNDLLLKEVMDSDVTEAQSGLRDSLKTL